MSDEQKRYRVLVPEDLGEGGLALLESAPDVRADIRLGLSREELLRILPHYDAIITRSGTKMDAEAIAAGTSLRVIARAGVGVDNVDIQAASRRGMIVINAPTGNTLAAAEQTMALMLSVMRHTPHACASMRVGEWNRKRFIGRQMSGKKLLVVGMGPIGSGVATRCRAFGMDVMGFDPFVSEAKMSEMGVQKVTDLLGSLSLADVVTVHVPVTAETHGMIGERALRAIKRGAFIINCARGGIIDEEACARAIRDGHIAGAAFDVFTEEPPSASHPLLADDIADRIVLTPHLGASTVEALDAVSETAVRNTIAALRGEEYEHAVNLPFMETQLTAEQRDFLRLSRKMGIIAAKLLDGEGPVSRCRVTLRGPLVSGDDSQRNKKRPYTIAAIKGLLEVSRGPDANYMIAPIMAEEQGIAIEETTGSAATYRNIVELEVIAQNSTARVHGTITEEGRQRIVRVNDYWLDFVPHGKILIFQNHDRPGVIGMMGKLLGDSGVNIANFNLGRKSESGLALAVMEVDGPLTDDILCSIRNSEDMIWAMTVDLGRDGE